MELTLKTGLLGLDRFYLGHYGFGSLKAAILLAFVITILKPNETDDINVYILDSTILTVMLIIAGVTFYIYDALSISCCDLTDSDGNVMIGCPE